MLLHVVGVVSSQRTGERVLAEVDNDFHRKRISERSQVFDVPRTSCRGGTTFVLKKGCTVRSGELESEAEKPEAKVLWNGAEGLLRDF